MGANCEVIVVPPGNAGKILKWKVKEGTFVSVGRVLLLYDVKLNSGEEESKKLKATQMGMVKKLLAREGETIQPGTALLELEECTHPTVMNAMCAECGADLRTENQTCLKASVPMVHSIPELKVSREQAEIIGKADEERLLNHRKLVLLVDLDQTLIHTTNDNIPPNIKDVYHFQLYGPASPWYHTRIRPGTQNFLKEMSQLYELHICTFGARNYAHTIATFLDRDGKYFSHRILSRDECFNSNSKTANLTALFPCGDNLVCIIDDREDVWNFAPNLIHVKPYHFFKHTGDINAPPGLTKHENDEKEGFDFGNIGDRIPQVAELPEKNAQEKKKEDGASEKEEPKAPSEKEEPKAPSEKEEPKVPIAEEAMEVDKEEQSKGDEAGEQVTKEGPLEDKGKEKEADNKEKGKEKEADNKEKGKEKEADNKEKGKKKEADNNEKEEAAACPTNTASVACHTDAASEENQKKIVVPSVEGDCVSKNETRVSCSEREVDVEDSDDYLMYLEGILKTIHSAFYQMYDDLKGDIPDLKNVIPYVRRKVLAGTHLVFSGLVPTHVPLEKSRVYQVARNLGAAVSSEIDAKTTHLVAVRPGTAKVISARRNKQVVVVTPEWLWCCAERWERVAEALFPLGRGQVARRQPPAHCGSPDHSPSASARFMDSINPLMSFSSEDIANMDREVEDIFNETESEGDGEESSEKETAEEQKVRRAVLEYDSSSSSADSLSGEHPHGWGPVERRKRAVTDSEVDEVDEDMPSTKFRRGEALPSDLDLAEDEESASGSGSEEPPDEIDDGDWNMMGAALEREFLSGDRE